MRRDTQATRTIIRTAAILAGLAACTIAPYTSAQASVSPRVLSGGGGGVVVVPNDPMLNPDSPEARAYSSIQGERRKIEQELRIIKRQHFGSMRVIEKREIGLRKLRGYRSQAAIMAMTDVFDDEGGDVRMAVLDHFSSLERHSLDGLSGTTVLAWEAVHGEDEWYRAEARRLLADSPIAEAERVSVEEGGEALAIVRGIIARGLQSQNDETAVAASRLVSALKLFEFIPLMATAQVAQRGGGDERTGDLGWIMIGRQQTYVADLQPVVSNSAVAFDPQIGVASDGVMIRIHDAVVTAYRTEIYRVLTDMTSDAWGRPTQSLGYDAGAWQDWYADEFVPHLAQQQAQRAAPRAEQSAPEREPSAAPEPIDD